MTVVDVDSLNPEVLHSDAVDPQIPTPPSWGGETLSQWRSTYDERLAVVSHGDIVRFRINHDADPRDIASQVRAEVTARGAASSSGSGSTCPPHAASVRSEPQPAVVLSTAGAVTAFDG
jgi:hypothetical protein